MAFWDGYKQGGTASAPPKSGGGFWSGYTPAPAAPAAVAPKPQLNWADSPRAQQYRKVFAEASPDQRNYLATQLATRAKAGDTKARDQLLAVQDLVTGPTKNAIKAAGVFGDTGLGAALSKVSDVVTGAAKGVYSGVVDPVLRGGQELTNLQNTGKLKNPKQFAADFINTGLNFALAGEGKAAVEGAKELPLGLKLLKGAGEGAAYNATSSALNDFGVGKTAKQIATAVPANAAVGAAFGGGTAGLAETLAKIHALGAPVDDATKSNLMRTAVDTASQVDRPAVGAVAHDLPGGAIAQDFSAEGLAHTPTPTPFTKHVEDTLADAAKTAGPDATARKGAHDFSALFTPMPGVDTRPVQNELRSSVGNLKLEQTRQAFSADANIKEFAKMKPAENLNFIQRIESGADQPTPALKAKANEFRAWFNQDYELAQSIKPDTNLRSNYFSHNGIWKDPKAAEAFYTKWMNPSLGGKPSALEQRSFPTIYDGIKAGLGVKETNPQIIALTNRAQLLKAKMAQDFMTAQAEKGVNPVVTQAVVDRYLDPGLAGNGVFQSIKQANNAINNINLGLSGFHLGTTTLNSVMSQFARGLQDITSGHPVKGAVNIAKGPVAPLLDFFHGGQIIKDVKAGNLTPEVKNIAGGGGVIGVQPDYQTTGLFKSLQELKTDPSIPHALKVPVAMFESVGHGIMGTVVPRMKAAAAANAVDDALRRLGPNASEEAKTAVRARVIDSIDNRYGQLVQDNIFWSKNLKQVSGLFMRSPGWNIGTVRELGGGAADLVAPNLKAAVKTAKGGGGLLKTLSSLAPNSIKSVAKGEGITERSAYALAIPMVLGSLGAAYQYLSTGKLPGSAEDFFYPKTGRTDKNGNAERISFPSYAKDVYAFFKNPLQTIANKQSPLLSEASQLIGNKDYFGNLIRNPDDPLLTQAEQIGDYLKSANLPFSITNASKRVDQGPRAKVETAVGINVAPGSVTQSSFDQKVFNLYSKQLNSGPQTPEQAAVGKQKSAAKAQIRTGGGTSLADSLIAAGTVTKGDQFKTNAQQSSLLSAFNGLNWQNKLAVLQDAKPADLARLGDLDAIRKQAAYDLQSKTTSTANKSAAKEALGLLGGDAPSLAAQRKQEIRTKAKQSRAAKK